MATKKKLIEKQRPNSPPLASYDCSRLFMIGKLLRATDLDLGLLLQPRTEYDRLANEAECDGAVEQDAARCPPA